jgi:hypothetical protein
VGNGRVRAGGRGRAERPDGFSALRRAARPVRWGLGCAAAAALLSHGAAAPAAAQLPPAREILDRHVRELGGREALLGRGMMHLRGLFEMPGAGLTGTLEAWRAPDRSLSVVDVPGLGEIRRGFDGRVAWSDNPIEGPRLLKGAELAQAMDDADFRADARDPDLIAAAETLERTQVEGQPCWRVRIAWKSGRTAHDCYSTETGLLVATTTTVATPMGELEATTLVGGYEMRGRVRMATRLVQRLAGQEQVLTLREVEFLPIDDARFALPPGIRALGRD